MSRHLSWEFLSGRINAGAPSVEPIQGEPLCQIHVERGGSRLSLIVSVAPEENETLPTFAAIECRRVGGEVLISSSQRDQFQEFYGFLMAVADRVQLGQQPLVAAIKDAVEAVRSLFAPSTVLSLEQQLGLWGELSTLRKLARQTSWREALSAWVAHANGPEEHDFSVADVDIEVKTTRGETRRHHISSGSQLRPKQGRKLFLISYQLTSGGAAGLSLPELVQELRKEVPTLCQKELEDSLRANGWHDIDSSQYPSRWLLRNAVTVIEANELPVVEVSGSNTDRVTSISYTIDVSGLGREVGEDSTWIG